MSSFFMCTRPCQFFSCTSNSSSEPVISHRRIRVLNPLINNTSKKKENSRLKFGRVFKKAGCCRGRPRTKEMTHHTVAQTAPPPPTRTRCSGPDRRVYALSSPGNIVLAGNGISSAFSDKGRSSSFHLAAHSACRLEM